MNSPFAITVATGTIRLETGRGETTVTVTNSSSRPLKARAEIVLARPEAVAWVSVPDPERFFPPNAVEQFVVRINVPQGAPEGDQTFVVRLSDVADPNERFTNGPTLGFKIAGAPPVVPPPPKLFPWWILVVAGAVFLVLVGGVVYWAAFREKGTPDVVTKTYDEAEKI